MERIDHQRNHSPNNVRIIIGIVFLTLGALLFADRLDIIPFAWNKYIFTWQSLLIGIGLISLAKNESRTTGIVLIAIGGFFLTAKILGFHYPIRYFFWPTVFVALGLIMIFQKGGHVRNSKVGFTRGSTDMDIIDDVAIFGGSEQKITSKNFKGGKISNIFGGSTFDLSDAELAPGRNVLDMFCLFGGSKIIVPAGWRVKIEVTAIFGGYNDKRRMPPKTDEVIERELVIRGVVIFGGGEIKSY
ncbi:MAG: LiaF-related protein [Tenuifilaceae bacterium]|nr:LiaF-related protein [Tenuifilaceae bacterium]